MIMIIMTYPTALILGCQCQANSFYRCPSNNEVTFAFPVNEVLSARRPGSRGTSPVSRHVEGRSGEHPSRHGMYARLALLIVPALAGKLFRASKKLGSDLSMWAPEVIKLAQEFVATVSTALAYLFMSGLMGIFFADLCLGSDRQDCPEDLAFASRAGELRSSELPGFHGALYQEPRCHEGTCPRFRERTAGQQGGAVPRPRVRILRIQIAGYPTVRTYHFKGDVGNALSGSRPDRSMVHNEDQFVAWLRRNVPENVTQAEVVVEAVTKGSGPSDEPSMSSSAGRGVRGAPQVDEIRRDPPRSSVVQDAMPALHLADAEVAVLYSLRQGAFLRGEGGVLRGWLDFLGRFFPGGGREHLRALADRIHEESGAVASAGDQLLVETFNEIMKTRGLDRIPPEAGLKPDAFWRHCHSFTCGLWSLFHMLSVAVAEEGPSTEIAGVAGQALLVRAFDSCKLDRCVVEPEDISGAVLWLWKMHNDVTLRVAKEDGRKIPDPWPPSEDAPFRAYSTPGTTCGAPTAPGTNRVSHRPRARPGASPRRTDASPAAPGCALHSAVAHANAQAGHRSISLAESLVCSDLE
eukprot:g27981.t1